MCLGIWETESMMQSLQEILLLPLRVSGVQMHLVFAMAWKSKIIFFLTLIYSLGSDATKSDKEGKRFTKKDEGVTETEDAGEAAHVRPLRQHPPVVGWEPIWSCDQIPDEGHVGGFWTFSYPHSLNKWVGFTTPNDRLES